MALKLKGKNSLIGLLPAGMITSRKWLLKVGFDRHAIDNFVKSRQLHTITNGIYIRDYSALRWQTVLLSLQGTLEMDVVIGGLTSLELQGYAHYIGAGRQRLSLYSSKPMPRWLNELPLEIEFDWHSNRSLLGKGTPEKDLALYSRTWAWLDDAKPIIISAAERAMFEVLVDVPKYVSFEYASQLMQAMINLSPQRVQELLEKCHNIKVRRLFLLLAEQENFSWYKKLDVSKIDLGSGNRVLYRGGKLNKKYKITLPPADGQ